MNAEMKAQLRHDLAGVIVGGGFLNCPETGIDVDLGVVLDSEADRGADFADEAADVLQTKLETQSEYAYRVQTWLQKITERHVTDAMIEEYAEQCDRDFEVERKIDEREVA